MAESADRLGGVGDAATSPNTSNIPSDVSGIYRAKCIDPQDPLKTGRIKVWIPAIHYTKEEDTNGTWAYPVSIYAGSNLEKDGGVKDFGSLCVPPKDSYVYVFFEDNDVTKPRYFGSVITEGAIPTECQNGKKWWDKHVLIKTPKKRMIFISDDDTTDACVIIRGMER